jgi:uncharacterized protein (UPF0276 family)
MSSKARLSLAVSHLFAQAGSETLELISLAKVLEIKTLPEPSWLPAEKERVFHWGFGLTEEGFASAFKKIEGYLREKEIPLFSCDLGPAASRRQGILPMSAILRPEKIIQRAEKALQGVRAVFKGRVAVENYNYFPTGLYEHICRPDFIGRFLETLDLELVLDLAHAAISAWNLGLNFSDYLGEFPLERVAEIHLSKPYFPGKARALAVDAHQKPGPGEFDWLTNTLKLLPKNLRAPLVTVEYYQSLKKLLAINKQILELIK